VKAAEFARAFKGGSWRADVTEARISRWETAIVSPTYLAIKRYEELLERSPNSFVTLAETLFRYVSPTEGAPALDRKYGLDSEDAERRVEYLVDRVVSGGPVTAHDWDELTACISALPQLILVPRSLWDELAQRLLLETLATRDCSLWMRRYESFSRLLTHPRGRRAAIAACASLCSDPSNLLSVEPMSLLSASSHPDASTYVLSQLADPTSEQSFYGALVASVRKAQFRHFTPAQNVTLARFVNDVLPSDPSRYADVRAVAAQVIRQVPAGVGRQIQLSLKKASTLDSTVQTVLGVGRLATPDMSRAIVGRLIARVSARLPHDGGGYQDRVLPSILDDLLFHPVIYARLHAGLLILESPYRRLVAGRLPPNYPTHGSPL
jgi:hypothetical protein